MSPSHPSIQDLEKDFSHITPPCPYYGDCGGCHLQHLSASDQLQVKSRWLQAQLDWIPGKKLRPILPSPQVWHYRRRIQLQVGSQGQVGFFAAGSQRVVEIEECLIADQTLNQTIPKIRELARQAVQDPKRSTLLAYELTLLGDGEVQIEKASQERAFLQVNAGANAELLNLLQQVFAKLQPKHVLELFAGSGNLTNVLSPQAKSWTAVESNAKAYLAGKQNTALKQTQWIQGSAHATLKKFAQKKKGVELILLDPPREGMIKGKEFLVKLHPPWILYVSCEVRSLRRDLKYLCSHGYEVEWVQPLDFFPQTLHLETVTLCKGV